MRRWWTVLLRGGIGVILASSAAFGAVIHVPADQPTIQAGMNAAVDGDTVLVAPGTYAEHLNFQSKRVVLLGRAGADSTTITKVVGGLSIVVFAGSEDSASILAGFTIRASYAASAISCTSSPTIRDDVFRDNSGGDGAAIRNDGGSPIIRNNTFTNNTDGTVYCAGGAATIERNVFSSNTVTGPRGLLYLVGGSTIVRGNLLSGNYVSYALLLASTSAQTLIDNNTIAANSGTGLFLGGSGVIRNNIVAFNGIGMWSSQGGLSTAIYNDVFGKVAGLLWNPPGQHEHLTESSVL